jgi:RNA-directed DNA polymerase
MNTSKKMMYGWNTIQWKKLEQNVFKLQKRIYQASSRGDHKTVHKLQRLLIKSRNAVCLAVRHVAQDNQGKRTAGIDGLASLRSERKLALALKILKDPIIPKAKPVRRVWISKPGKDEKRPLGIPVMEDRARQALAKMALEPEWEAKFEPNSYGFRPGRSCHDAIKAVFNQLIGASKYVLDADISKCFDRINHEALLDKLGTFPKLRRAIRAWLKAGIMDGGKLFPMVEGTPQGGVISPLLANIALHGLALTVEDAFQKNRYFQGRSGPATPWEPKVIRYADDFVIFHRDLEALKRAKQIAEDWLKGIGLELKSSKTRITHTLKEIDGSAGFNFLGFNIRQYPRGKNKCMRDTHSRPLGFTIMITPSKESQKRFNTKIRDIVKSNRNIDQNGLIQLMNPVIRGWGNYYSTVVSKEIFKKMDSHIFWKLWSWALHRHPNKGRRWVARRYWLLDKCGWVFSVDGKITLHKLAKIPIRRHILVQGHRSPYDGDAFYWSSRLGRYPLIHQSLANLIKKQEGYCPICGRFFVLGDSFYVIRHTGSSERMTTKEELLIHKHCRWLPDAKRVMTKHHSTEEPYEGKLSRAVLKTSANREVCT